MQKNRYDGSYIYTYCTKSSHFSFVIEEVLKNDVHLETSSAYDLEIIRKLHEKGQIDKKIKIVFVKSELNDLDIFTKNLNAELFDRHSNKMVWKPMDMDMSVGKKKVVKPRVGVGARTEIRKGVEGDQGGHV